MGIGGWVLVGVRRASGGSVSSVGKEGRLLGRIARAMYRARVLNFEISWSECGEHCRF